MYTIFLYSAFRWQPKRRFRIDVLLTRAAPTLTAYRYGMDPHGLAMCGQLLAPDPNRPGFAFRAVLTFSGAAVPDTKPFFSISYVRPIF